MATYMYRIEIVYGNNSTIRDATIGSGRLCGKQQNMMLPTWGQHNLICVDPLVELLSQDGLHLPQTQRGIRCLMNKGLNNKHSFSISTNKHYDAISRTTERSYFIVPSFYLAILAQYNSKRASCCKVLFSNYCKYL